MIMHCLTGMRHKTGSLLLSVILDGSSLIPVRERGMLPKYSSIGGRLHQRARKACSTAELQATAASGPALMPIHLPRLAHLWRNLCLQIQEEHALSVELKSRCPGPAGARSGHLLLSAVQALQHSKVKQVMAAASLQGRMI